MPQFQHVAAKVPVLERVENVGFDRFSRRVPGQQKAGAAVTNFRDDGIVVRIVAFNIAIRKQDAKFRAAAERHPHPSPRKDPRDLFFRNRVLKRFIRIRVFSNARFEKIAHVVEGEHVDQAAYVVLIRMRGDHYINGTIGKRHDTPEAREYRAVGTAVDEKLRAIRSFYIYGVALPDIKKGDHELSRRFGKRTLPDERRDDAKGAEKHERGMFAQALHPSSIIPSGGLNNLFAILIAYASIRTANLQSARSQRHFRETA